ncbi:NHL repeat-containing protein [Variovorax sp. PBL-E5]|uniref:NHL repeat-containing protein n=1 Tax=Variovorax sp. PBL-E5 TaxID=434014 RepID=UPI0013161AD6|nr:NHL repeat-containing protein [Variovorax sp. PBL-E5]VTU33919.1 Serine/threonine-protein kinase PknD [Variovorax sp. PBL-E5]
MNKYTIRWLVASVCLLLTACGGGSGSGTPFFAVASSSGSSPPAETRVEPVPPPATQLTATPPEPSQAEPPAARHIIGGTLSGLPPEAQVVLLDHGGDALTLTADGPFSFATSVASGAAYAVTVGTQPAWSGCTVRNGSGSAAADVTSVSVICAGVSAQVTTLAGGTSRGALDGVGGAASFNAPVGVAVDAAGKVYVGDTQNNNIREIAPGGAVTTLAGSTSAAFADGTGRAASFNAPQGVAVDDAGMVYVADYANHAIRKITPDGVVSTLAGSGAAGSFDGAGRAASFYFPAGVAVDAQRNVYVADTGNHLIRKITPDGAVSTFAGSGALGGDDGAGRAASFRDPYGVAVDAAGNVYVADYSNNRIRKITPDGVVSTLAGSGAPGSDDGAGGTASFRHPYGVAVGLGGNVYVADYGNNRIRRITPAGVVSTLAGDPNGGFADGIDGAASFDAPTGVAVDASGNLYVADSANNAIRKIAAVRP